MIQRLDLVEDGGGGTLDEVVTTPGWPAVVWTMPGWTALDAQAPSPTAKISGSSTGRPFFTIIDGLRRPSKIAVIFD